MHCRRYKTVNSVASTPVLKKQKKPTKKSKQKKKQQHTHTELSTKLSFVIKRRVDEGTVTPLLDTESVV